MKSFVYGLIGFVACTACATVEPPQAVSLEPDAVYINGAIWQGNGEEAQALAIKDGVIVAIGDSASIKKMKKPSTRIVDLKGARVVPGFIDNHTHFISSGLALTQIDLHDAVSKDEFVARVAEFAATHKAGEWLLGGLWDHERWGGALPTKEWIDAVTPDNPVFLMRYDGHMGLANSLALQLAGVTATTPAPQGGEIVRGADGAPAGVLKDAAMFLVTDMIPEPTTAQLDAAFDAAQRVALRAGVTQIHDMGDASSRDDWTGLSTFMRARERGALDIRIYAFTQINNWRRLSDYIAEYGRGDSWLRWGGVKGFVDGSLGSTTAWFYDPYEDAPETSGLAWGPEELEQNIEDANAAGLHIAVHAIGDRAIDWLLGVYDKVQKDSGARDQRFRIEHAQHLSPQSAAEFRRLGVIASMQPYHAIDDGRWAEKRIGKERLARAYAFRTLLDAGVTVTFGSDWNVAPLDPLLGVYAAATRRTLDGANPEGWVPSQKISVEEALHAYTAANAFAGFEEEAAGTLEPGKLADFVVLSDDILSIDPADIGAIRVTRTVIGGEDRYVGK